MHSVMNKVDNSPGTQNPHSKAIPEYRTATRLSSVQFEFQMEARPFWHTVAKADNTVINLHCQMNKTI